MVWLIRGRAEARKEKNGIKYVRNLTHNGFATKTGYLIPDKEHVSLWLILAVAGALNYIEQIDEEEGGKKE